MQTSYDDITTRLGPPAWWDERGVPRYVDFDPTRSTLAFAGEGAEVALVRCRCSHCQAEALLAVADAAAAPGAIAAAAARGAVSLGERGAPICCLAPIRWYEPLAIEQLWTVRSGSWARRRELEGPVVEADEPSGERVTELALLVRDAFLAGATAERVRAAGWPAGVDAPPVRTLLREAETLLDDAAGLS